MLARIVLRLLADLAGLVVLSFRPRRSVAAENFSLRRQLALYQERGVKPGRVKSRPGRPPIPLELRQPIRRMATENPLWGEERIANELQLKLGLRVSPRTVRNHADAIVACDFFVAVTATFRLLYVFVVIEHGSRRLVRVAVTAHPTATWTLQQLREVVGFDHARRYRIHDRDSMFARSLDESIRTLGLTALKSPPHSPKANAICERVIGTIRRPHMALGPGVSDPPSDVVPSATQLTRHRIGERVGVIG